MSSIDRAPKPLDFLQQLRNEDARLDQVLRIISGLPLEDIALFGDNRIADAANKTQKLVAKELKADLTKLREIDTDPRNLTRVAEFLKKPGAKAAGMRHGGQLLDEETLQLPEPFQKIRAMQPPHNMNDPLTSVSLAEAVGTAIVVTWLQKKSGKGIIIRSSKFRRAAQVAAVFAAVTKGNVDYDQRLNCVNYRTDKTDEELLGILKNEKGLLVLEKDIVDEVCGEEGTYHGLTEDVLAMLAEATLLDNSIVLGVTHRQQTQVFEKILGRVPTQWDELGLGIVGPGEDHLILPNGFYAN